MKFAYEHRYFVENGLQQEWRSIFFWTKAKGPKQIAVQSGIFSHFKYQYCFFEDFLLFLDLFIADWRKIFVMDWIFARHERNEKKLKKNWISSSPKESKLSDQQHIQARCPKRFGSVRMHFLFPETIFEVEYAVMCQRGHSPNTRWITIGTSSNAGVRFWSIAIDNKVNCQQRKGCKKQQESMDCQERPKHFSGRSCTPLVSSRSPSNHRLWSNN